MDSAAAAVKGPLAPGPENAIRAVLAAFERHPLVALGEVHGLREQHRFFHDLIRHPDFANRVNDIVIEWANARHQPVLDRYLAGEDAPVTDLRAVWRDHSASPVGPWDAEAYEEFFAVVREVNAKLPPARQLRVLAGDPPVDWSGPEAERIRLTRQRDRHFAEVVVKEVLDRKRKGLLLIGVMHVRRGLKPNPAVPLQFASEFATANVTRHLETSHPGSLYVILPHDGVAGNPDPSIRKVLEEVMKEWPRPSVMPLKGSAIGQMDASHFIPAPVVIGAPAGFMPPNPVSVAGLTLADLGDAYLYLGSGDSLTASRVSPGNFHDRAYLEELSRRQGGQPFDVGQWRAKDGPYGLAGEGRFAR
jgi:uncharacterized iron-regulated protein